MDTNKGIIYEYPYGTSTATIEDCVNRKVDDTNQKYLNEVNGIGADEEGE